MRRVEIKKCKKCGKTYVFQSGGVVATPGYLMDCGLCPSCRIKKSKGTLKKVIDIFR